MNIAAIQSLDAELRSLVSDERKGLVAFLRRLDVLDRAQAFPALNCTSAFDYLVRKLHLPESTAWRRVTAMRLIRAYPQLEAALEEGRLNTTQLGVLAPIFTPENIDDLILRATHLSKRQTEELAVSIRPKEVPADGLRKLPAPAQRPANEPAAFSLALPAANAPVGTPLVRGLRTPEPAALPRLASVAPPFVPSVGPTSVGPESRDDVEPRSVPLPRTRLEPVAAERWQWRIGLDAARKAKLDRLRGYLAHKIPDGDLEKVFDQMLDDSLEKHGKRLGFVAPSRQRKPAPPRPPTPGQRAPIPLPVRREVLQRDGYRCTFTGHDGERCPCTTRLEMDHLDPAKETGRSTAADLTTRCRSPEVSPRSLADSRGRSITC
jgi:hypothetical protein